MSDNWYIILELEFDPNPVQDQAVINQKIDDKAKFWSSKFNDFNKGAEYRKYHQMIPNIRKAMSDPEEREHLIKEACDLIYGPIDKLVKTIGRKGEITDDEINKIADKQRVAAEIVKKRAVVLGVKIGRASAANFQATYDKYYKTKPQSATTFEGMKPLLNSFNVENLYDFLYANTPTRNANKLPCDALRQKATERKKNEFYKNDAISGSGAKLCGQCDLAFKDDDSRDVYDKYLEYSKRKIILDEMKSIADISGELSEEQVESYIGQLTELFKDRKLSKDVLVAFCKIEKINFKDGKDEPKNLKVCRCGYTNNISDDRRVCQSCGEDLYIRCPKCGTENDANIKVCKCAFKFENIDKALALCDLAEQAIEALEFVVAQAHLTDAEKYWPKSSKVRALSVHLAEFKKRGEIVAKAMRDAITGRRYYEAQKHYATIKKLFPEYKDIELANEIEAAVSTAKNLLQRAQNSHDEKVIIDNCANAYEACKDYPGIKELISKYPPQVPSNLKISVDGNSRANSLSWEKSSSIGSVYYSVVRKQDAIPVNVGDGELIGRVSMCGYNDNKVTPGANYFYAVFAERAGAYSNPLVLKNPTINLFEIAGVTIAAGDALLQIEWEILPKGATVEVFRKNDTGEDEKITSITSVSYLDSGLVNDKVYHYILKLIYNVNGQRQMTNGVSISGIPTKPPKAIESLIVKPMDGDNFEAVWENLDNAEVQLYCSTEKPEYNFGDLISQTVLETKMKRLALNKTSSSSASFQYKGEELLYITASVVKSGSVIFGALARASKGETVNIKNIAVVNDKINIYLDPPKDTTGFVVLYRLDQYPVDISDVQTVRKYIPLKQYQHHSALVIDALEQKNYYFSVYAEFCRDGEKDYSIGADYLFMNASKEVITYAIHVTKKMFGESTVVIDFEAENKVFTLPDIEIMSAVGNTPMFKASAKLFSSISSQLVNGSTQVKIPFPKRLEKDTYIKAFLKDEKQSTSYQLKLKVKSNYKIY